MKEYPTIVLLLEHKKIGDERKWFKELTGDMKERLKKEISLLSENAEIPSKKYWKHRMMFFEVANIFMTAST
jgi:hypothetical protein